jgi:hypothetical protein
MNTQIQTIEFVEKVIPSEKYYRVHSLRFSPFLMIFSEFNVVCDNDEASKVSVGITAPDHQVFFPINKLPGEFYFPIGPHRLAYGSFDHKFVNNFQSSQFDFYAKNTSEYEIEVEFSAEIIFIKNLD